MPLVAVGPGRPEDRSAMTTVAFGPAPRPEAGTTVAFGTWEGPLGLLLSLIEARRLDVMTVPLGPLAGAYLEALATLEGDRLGHISAFVAVASQLILIKSRELLPRRDAAPLADGPEDDGPDPELELRERLVVYRAFRDAGLRLADGPLRHGGLFRREPDAARAAAHAGARLPSSEPLDPDLLATALEGLVRIAPPPAPPPEVLARTISLAERAAIIRAALREAPRIVLQDLLAGVRDRVVVAVTFLAMLELVKRREVVVEQAEPFGPIVARLTTRDERMRGGLTRGPDDSPLDESLESYA